MHVNGEYDYRFYGDFRREIFDALKHTYWKLKKENLPVWAVANILEEHYTLSNDIKNNNEKTPGEEFRV